MKILVIGGTRFLGRHLVDIALSRGHEMTLFHRGNTNKGLFDKAEELLGDRDGDLSQLDNRTWDTAIDTCGYFPRIVTKSAEKLKNSVGQYVFVSSVSVYRDVDTIGLDESAAVRTIEDETVEEITGETYGALKALCEKAVQERFPQRTLIVRPGLIVGPHDPSDRFTYWVRRVAQGGELLAPEPKDLRTQLIDARDLSAWILDRVEEKHAGVYHATGPKDDLTMQALLYELNRTFDQKADPVWLTEKFLLDNDVAPWTELPMWLVQEKGMMAVNVSNVFASGLVCRPIAETARDVLAWDTTRPTDIEYFAGMKPEREAELLKAWKTSRS